MKSTGVVWRGGPRDELRQFLEQHGLDYSLVRSVALIREGSRMVVDVIEYQTNEEGSRFLLDQAPIPVRTSPDAPYTMGRVACRVACAAVAINLDEHGCSGGIEFPYLHESAEEAS